MRPLRPPPAPRGPFPPSALPPRSPPPGFPAPAAPSVRLAVLGDLHLDARHAGAFEAAAAQIRGVLEEGGRGGGEARLIQLGDLGASAEAPGTTPLFARARAYLASAQPDGAPPPALVVGNHDLEGTSEFDALHPADDSGAAADAANLAAWGAVFDQAPAWTARLGPALAVGLSTASWRSNKHSVHEVAIPVADIEWFEDTVADAARTNTPVLVFTHAPPAGCGLRVVQGVHVRNRCAFLNHADRAVASRFVAAVERHANVALWCSGHYHLSHNYATSLSVVNRTVFCQVGVIGPGSSRDGVRQSRVVDVGADGWRLFSLDHGAGGALRLDVDAAWGGIPHPRPVPRSELLDPAADAAWLASALDCDVGAADDDSGSDSDGALSWPAPAAARAAPAAWLDGGGDCLVSVGGDGAVVEYSAALRCPVGFVFDGVPAGGRVRRVGADGGELADAADGGAAVAVEALDADGAVVERRERNEEGGFAHTFQENKWRKARRAAREAEAAGVAA